MVATDKALAFSDLLFMSARRVGQVRPEDLTDQQRQFLGAARTQLIDARAPAGFLGHAYFYRHPAVSADLVLLLRYQLEPGSPGRPLHTRGRISGRSPPTIQASQTRQAGERRPHGRHAMRRSIGNTKDIFAPLPQPHASAPAAPAPRGSLPRWRTPRLSAVWACRGHW